MPMIAIKKWKSRNHPVPKSNIKTNSSGGDSFELNAISIICHPPSDESNESEPNPIEIFEQLPNGKLCLLKVSKSQKQFSNALSFYRSQNVLCQSKVFVSDQKFIYILCQSQTFFARQKNDLHSVKLVFVPAQKFLKRH
jgi:hypothetical protein